MREISLSSRVTENVTNIAPITAHLKSALLAKDARIEQLETENQRLRDRIALSRLDALRSESARDLETTIGQGPRNADPRPSPVDAGSVKYNWELPIVSDFVRLAGPAQGVYQDNWAGPRMGVAFVSKRPLSTVTLNIWFKPTEREQTASLTIRIDGNEVNRASVELSAKSGNLSTIAFAVEIAADTVFMLSIESDHRARTAPPEKRTLCYVIRSIGFA